MTTPAQPPPVDAGNPLLAEQAARLTTALVQTAAGQRMVLTIRTPSTTLTVFLGKADADMWAANIKHAAGQMSGAGLIVAGVAGAAGVAGVAGGNGLPVNGQEGA